MSWHGIRPTSGAVALFVLLQTVSLIGPAAGGTTSTVLLVDTTEDNAAATGCVDSTPNDCSLRGALINANADGAAEIEQVQVPAGTYQLSIAGDSDFAGSINILYSVDVVGAGPGATIIDANGIDRALVIWRGSGTLQERTVNISGITFRNGHLCGGTGDTGGHGSGGGIFTHGVVTLDDVVVEDNFSCGAGGGIFNGLNGQLAVSDSTIHSNTGPSGGGMHTAGPLTVTDSTIADNVSSSSGGGLMVGPPGAATLERTTVSGNTSGLPGGGIAAGNDCCSAALTLINSTVSGNLAKAWSTGTPQHFPGRGGGIHTQTSTVALVHTTITNNTSQNHPQTGGIGTGAGLNYSNSIVDVKNSIIFGNIGLNDCSSGSAASGTTNMIGIDACGIPGTDGIDPLLQQLANDGGPTRTHAIGQESPAKDAADEAACVDVDQRGIPRPQGSGCEIGSYEVQPALSLAPCQVEEGDDDSTDCTFHVSLEDPATQQVAFSYTTTPGTASTDLDYAATTGQGFIPAGSSSVDIPVPVEGDLEREIEEENFTLTLSQIAGAAPGPLDAQGLIVDNDPLFHLFRPGATGMPWENSFLLSLLSHYVYEDQHGPDVDTWEEFLPAFDQRVESWGLQRVGEFNESVLEEPLPTIGSYDTQGTLVENEGAFIVTFRGTETSNGWESALQDLVTDATLRQLSVEDGKVHRGFWRAVVPVYNTIADAAREATDAGKKIWLTGHSLGGALASVTAYRLRKDGIPVQGIVTVGSPRVGDPTFAESFDQMFKNKTNVRWVDDDDLVPQIPPTEADDLDYEHLGRLNHITPIGAESLKSDTTVAINTVEPAKLFELSLQDHDTALYAWRIYENLDDSPRDIAPTLRDRVREFPIDRDPEIGTGLSAEDAALFLRNFLYDAADVVEVLIGMTAEQAAAILDTLEYNAQEIARALIAKFESTARQVAEILEALGFPALAIGKALVKVFGSGIDKVVDILKAVGFTASEIAEVLVKLFNLGADRVIEKLKKVGFAVADIMVALRDKLALKIDVILGKLKSYGYTAVELAAAIKEKLLEGAAKVTERLSAWFGASPIAAALQAVFLATAEEAAAFLKAHFDPTEIAKALKARYQRSAAQVAEILHDLHTSATRIARAMRIAFDRNVEQTAALLHGVNIGLNVMVQALIDEYQVGADKMISILRDLGFTAAQIMQVVRTKFGTSVDALVGKMKSAGYAAWEIAQALKTWLSELPDKVTERLAAWFGASPIMEALRDVFNKGAKDTAELLDGFFPATAIASALKAKFALGYAAAGDILKKVGFKATTIARAIRDAYDKGAAKIAGMLKDIGYGLLNVATAVFNAFEVGFNTLKNILLDLGYSLAEILAVLASLYA